MGGEGKGFVIGLYGEVVMLEEILVWEEGDKFRLYRFDFIDRSRIGGAIRSIRCFIVGFWSSF